MCVFAVKIKKRKLMSKKGKKNRDVLINTKCIEMCYILILPLIRIILYFIYILFL